MNVVRKIAEKNEPNVRDFEDAPVEVQRIVDPFYQGASARL